MVLNLLMFCPGKKSHTRHTNTQTQTIASERETNFRLREYCTSLFDVAGWQIWDLWHSP